jgi:threonine dehydrogenase-like Zn-dependent dehydrogenase
MRALTVLPGVANSARLDDVPEPSLSDGPILVRSVALGVCGTDREIVGGEYGAAPAGHERLILGHESFGRVESAPAETGFAPGDFIVGIVRRPDPVPCPACAADEWDMCRNGLYTERGIKERHGFCAERFRIEPHFAIKVSPELGILGVLMEPTSIVAKAWDHLDRIGQRSRSWKPHVLAVTGAGPIGLLAALMGKQRRLEVHVLDHNDKAPKPALTQSLGAIFHANGLADLDKIQADIVIECTGAVDVIAGVLGHTAPSGIICLAGVTAPGRMAELDIGLLNRTMVLNNEVIFGTVNANRKHYEMAAAALAAADKAWLGRLITRRVPLERWPEALKRQSGDIKVIIEFAA